MLLIQAIRRNAQKFPTGTATHCEDRIRSWVEFEDRVARAAEGLRKLGAKPGERIGILGLNSDHYMEALNAIWWCGAVAVPMNIRWSLEENLYSAKDAGLVALIADDAFAEMSRDVAARMEGETVGLVHIGVGTTPDGFLSFEALIKNNEATPATDRGNDELVGIYYTGGTTGFPKGVMLSALALWSSSMALASAMGFDESTISLHAAPMFHLADGAMSIGVTIMGGMHTFIPAFTPGGVLAAIEAHGVSVLLLVPTMISMLLDAPEMEGADISSVRQLAYGASPMPEAIVRKTRAAMPNVSMFQAYGQTELAPIVSILPPENHALDGPKSKLRSAGKAAACVEIKIMGEDGTEAPRMTPGEIWASGPNAMMGYWNMAEATAETLVDGWVKTGDVAYMDDEGFIFICDRAKDMIISGGENVFSAEVENAASSHPAVAQVAVIGIPDEKYGEGVHAVVVLAPGASITQDELYAHCKTHIAGYKCPRSMEVIDAMPISGAGKILKTTLREPHWKDRDRGVS